MAQTVTQRLIAATTPGAIPRPVAEPPAATEGSAPSARVLSITARHDGMQYDYLDTDGPDGKAPLPASTPRQPAPRSPVSAGVTVRVSPNFRLDAHVDTDEANAAELGADTVGYIESADVKR